MANLGNFNADDYENEYSPIPAGEYIAAITSSEMKTSAKGNPYLALTFDLVDGSYKGRKLFVNLNLNHPDAKTEKIAATHLADICRSVGILHPRDSSELHNKPMRIKVIVKPETKEYPASNEIKRWNPLGQAAQSVPDAKTVEYGEAVPEPAAPSGNRKPWEK